MTGAQVKVPVHYSNVVITKLRLDPFRRKELKKLIAKKKRARKRLGLDPSGIKEKKKTVKTEKQEAKVDLD